MRVHVDLEKWQRQQQSLPSLPEKANRESFSEMRWPQAVDRFEFPCASSVRPWPED